MSNFLISNSDISNSIRLLSIDSIQNANSGHPGMPMGMAEIGLVLWKNYINHNPIDPNWINRDRFILSNGHGSILIYILLHLTGYDIAINDIKKFRKLNSITPGHPEIGITPGIETTTGPLGQGIGNAVGIALSESLLSKEFNKSKNYDLINHCTYVFVGDGCLMEGISHELCSIAGFLNLSKLIILYDNNGISIDGNVRNWLEDDIYKRFDSYGWNILENINGHDINCIDRAINKTRENISNNKGPTIIVFKTLIGKGSDSLQGTSKIHGSPLGYKEIKKIRKKLKFKYNSFNLPKNIYKILNAKNNGLKNQIFWHKKLDSYSIRFNKKFKEFIRRVKKKIPKNINLNLKKYYIYVNKKQKNISTRKASNFVINIISKELPDLIGGSADLTDSNCTKWKGAISVRKQDKKIKFGRYINYGVREFGMSSILNGFAIYGGYIPFGGTFLTFSDYLRNGLRMSAIMKIRVIYIFTHDSIGLGEDGPTHQPIEHISSLRLIPNLSVWRPCDIKETFVAWQVALNKHYNDKLTNNGPTALLCSRQNLNYCKKVNLFISYIKRGAYILNDELNSKIVIISTGSEISLTLLTQKKLKIEGINIRLVSMPSTDTFDIQSNKWKNHVLPNKLPRMAIEAGSTEFWYKYVGFRGKVLGIDTYGKSASSKDLFNFFQFNYEKIKKIIKNICFFTCKKY